MKKIINILFILLISISSNAQFQVWRDGKIIYSSSVNEIDSLTFHELQETPDQKRNLDYIYDINSLPEITIDVTKQDWNQFLANYDANKDNGLYVPSKVTFKKGSDVFVRDSVGLRQRGNTSRRRVEDNITHQSNNTNWHHIHFGLKFTEYDTGERFFGNNQIYLKWFKDDPTYIREVFCYNLLREFGVWSSPHASYCKLYIHVQGDDKPAYFGIYAMIEGVRKGWLNDRNKEGLIPDKDGNLWKAAYNWAPADLSDFNTDFGMEKMGVSDEGIDFPYALKSNKKKGLPAAKTELHNFMENMRPLASNSEELKNYLEQHIDVDLFLRFLAVNVVVGSWDDIWANANNYFFYFDSNHKFYIIPYDYDNTLGTSSGGFTSGNSGTCNPLYWGSREGDRLLIRKILSIKEFEDSYVKYLKQLVTDKNLMEPNAAIERVKSMQNLVRPYISNDTGEDEYIYDSPASWSNINYHLLDGNSNGNDGSNFFRTKATVINKM